jgi:hypothetical protein
MRKELSMRSVWLVLAAFILTAVGAQAATIWWEQIPTYEDGTALPPGEVTGYIVYKAQSLNGPQVLLGTTSGTSFVVPDTEKGKWIFIQPVGKGGESSQVNSIRWFPPAGVTNIRITK